MYTLDALDGRSVREDAQVAVVGLGKIGLPLAVQYARHGWHVIGCDIHPQVVELVNAGRSHVQGEPGLIEGVADAVALRWLTATLDTTEAVRQAQVVVVIVPVAITGAHEVDFASIDEATTAIGKGLQPGMLVIYETTLPVGTTAGRLARLLESSSQLKAGQDFCLAFSPERVSSGYIFRDLALYPKVVGGINEESTAAAVAFYRSVLDADVITMDSVEEAEFVKLIETTYRDVNIALANEYARFADAHGLDVMAAIAAANTQPYSHIHVPGVGVGGHCIPVYPYFLLAGSGAEQEPTLTLPRFARHINDSMALYAIERIEAIIGSLAGRSILVLGVSYRADVHETAFTSARLLRDTLLDRGAKVYADDPLFSQEELQALGYVPFSLELKEDISAIILQAAHRAYQKLDFSLFSRCEVVLDGRMALSREQIKKPGIHYIGIGDGRGKGLKRQGEKDYSGNAAFSRGGG